MFEPGRTYQRRELHDMVGGQRQGGISTPAMKAVVPVRSISPRRLACTLCGDAGSEPGRVMVIGVSSAVLHNIRRRVQHTESRCEGMSRT